jgi:PAS domain S-box-containing protein
MDQLLRKEDSHADVPLDPAAILREALDEIYVIDAQTGRFVYANDLAVSNTGYSLDELQLMTPLNLQRDVDFDTITARIEPLRSGKEPAVSFETTYYRKDGSAYLVEHRVQLLHAHEPPVFVARARPIAEAERPSGDSSAHDTGLYKRLVEGADEGIWVIDAEHRTTYANEAMARMLGYSVDQLLGKPIFDFMDDEGRAIAAANMERRKQGEHGNLDFKYIRQDGSEVWAHLASCPMFGRDGVYTGAYAIVRDITEHRLQEHALLEAIHLKEPREIWREPPVAGSKPQVRMPGVLGPRAIRVAKRFSVLSDPRRLELIELLASDYERTVTELGKELKMTQSNVSKHLKVLAEAGLVSLRRDGTRTIYSLTDPTVAILCRIVYHWLGNQAEAEAHALAS